MNNNPIGIFDSGIGGLTICKEIMGQLPDESIIYIGDSLHAPYGGKSAEELYALSRRMVDFLLAKKVKLLVIACNTITVSCLNTLRADYQDIPLVGTVPVVKTAVEVTRNKRIGILSTTYTAKSSYQKELIQKFAKGCAVYNHGTDALVPLIERGEVAGEQLRETLRKVLAVFQQERIDTLALGCTHFPLLKREINEVLGEDVKFLDSSAAVARQVKRILTHNHSLGNGKKKRYRLYTTGDKTILIRVAKKIGIDTITTKGYKIKL